MSQEMTALQTNYSSGPGAHSSLVGGSTADRRLGCAASYQLEQKIPAHIRNASTSYADEGSALHAAIQYILEENLREEHLDTQVLDREFGDPPYVMTQELIDNALLPCMDFIDSLIEELKDEGDFLFELETQCAMPGIDGAFGTTDLIFRTNKRSGIVDWKFGEGVAVKAFYTEKDGVKRGNSQGLFYGRAGMNTLPDMFEDVPDWPVDIYIVQPRGRDGQPISHYAATVGELEAFRLKLIDAVKAAQAANPLPVKGPWCNFASCKTICPLHTGALMDLSKLALLKAKAPEAYDWNANMDFLLELAEIGETTAKAIFAMAQTHLEEGGSVLGDDGEPSWKLVPKRGVEKVVDEVGMVRHAIGMGLDEDKVYQPREVRSAAQLGPELEPFIDKTEFKTKKARVDEARRQLRDFTVTASSGHTLARASDKRPDVTPTPQLLNKLADKLALLTK